MLVDLHGGDHPGAGVPSGLFRVDEGDSFAQVQLVDHIGLTLMQMDRSGVQGRRCPPRVRGPEQPAAAVVDDRDPGPDPAPYVDVVVRRQV